MLTKFLLINFRFREEFHPQLKRYISKLGHDYNFQEDDIVEVDIDKIKNGYDVSFHSVSFHS